MPRNSGALLVFIAISSLSGCSSLAPRTSPTCDPAALPGEWRTLAERTEYQQTGRYADCVAFCKKLADESPFVHYASFGRSGEDRELPLLILSSSRSFTPERARRDGKVVMLVENCIHAGECCGKDACLELARNLILAERRPTLLDHVNLLILPIFSTDGHERFGPYNRFNQDGPREMGWRTTAQNYNLNRDFIKADAVEMRAWLKLWREWRPDIFFDMHTTNGADHQHYVFYAATTTPFSDAPVAEWTRNFLDNSLLPALDADGHNPFPYGGPIDKHDISQGYQAWCSDFPRYSHGYGAACNRPSILLELHAHKTYAQRVRVSYDALYHTLEALNRDHDSLRTVVSQADQHAVAARGAYADTGEIVLDLKLSDRSRPAVFKAYEHSFRPSEITGAEIIEYTDVPMDVETQVFDQPEITRSVVPPAAYLIPPQWTEIIERLEWHGLEFFTLADPVELEVDSYRLENVVFPRESFENRSMPGFKAVPIRERRRFLPGTAVVPMNQERAKLAAHILEPDAPDSLLRWGLMNIIFERKEYPSDFVLEPIALKMLADDPALKREFEAKLADDEEFAQSPWARMDFFTRRTPYWDPRLNVYPVARLSDENALDDLRAAR